MLGKICITFIAVEVVLFGLTSSARTITHYRLDFSLASAQSWNDGSEHSDADEAAPNPPNETPPDNMTSRESGIKGHPVGGSGTLYDHDLGVGDFSLTFNCLKPSGTWESTFSTGTHSFTGSVKGRQLKLNLENSGPEHENCQLQAVGHLLPSDCSCGEALITSCDCPFFGTYTVLKCGKSLKADHGAFLLNLETFTDGCI
jgi:hypothetical protein